jgi:hypothetical protein
MRNSGRQLEQLVKDIEQHLLPERFNVELNDRVFNEDGIQIAEFDIVITGRLGSSSVKWLIECRDRPSDGPAPGAWVEQLLGRKVRFNFDQVIAVSTTGFAEGAKEFADRAGIILRTVKKVDDIGSDFRVRGMVHVAVLVKVLGPIHVDLRDPSEPLDSCQMLSSDVRIKLPSEGAYQSVQDFVARRCSVNPFSLSDDSKTYADFQYDGLLELLVGNKNIQIKRLVTPVEYSSLSYTGKMLAVNVYSEADRVIGQEAQFYFDLPTGSFVYRVQILNEPDGTGSIRFHIPENVPVGNEVNRLHMLAQKK